MGQAGGVSHQVQKRCSFYSGDFGLDPSAESMRNISMGARRGSSSTSMPAVVGCDANTSFIFSPTMTGDR